jgi:hypothetical protein
VTRGAVVAPVIVMFGSLLHAQEASVFMGGTHARYADSLAGTAVFGAARLVLGGGPRAARLEASYSRFTDSGWAMQLSAQGTVLRPIGGAGGPPWLGVALGGVVADYTGGSATGTLVAGPLAVVNLGAGYVSGGATGGAIRRLDATWAALGSGALRGVWPLGSRANVELGLGATVADTLRFLDASVVMRLLRSAYRVSTTLGVRAGDLDDPWGALEIAGTVHRAVGIEIAAGRYPPDPTGFTEGLYLQAGVRLYAWRPPRPAPAFPAGRPALVADVRGPDSVRVMVRLATPARVVAIAGDWSGWEPMPMTRAGDGWVAMLRLPAGIHKYAILADGAWTLPTGVIGMDDGFGGTVGILVVPGRT